MTIIIPSSRYIQIDPESVANISVLEITWRNFRADQELIIWLSTTCVYNESNVVTFVPGSGQPDPSFTFTKEPGSELPTTFYLDIVFASTPTPSPTPVSDDITPTPVPDDITPTPSPAPVSDETTPTPTSSFDITVFNQPRRLAGVLTSTVEVSTTATTTTGTTTAVILTTIAATTAATAIGDPHIVSWDGLAQTVRSEGDFVLASSETTGMAIHTRHCNLRHEYAAWTCGVVLRCNARSAPLEVTALDDWNSLKSTSTMTVFKIAPDVVGIACHAGVAMVLQSKRLKWAQPYLNVHIVLRNAYHKDIRGLLGTPNGNRLDDIQVRNGTIVTLASLREHYIGHSLEDLDDVHQSWLLPPSESLFTSPFQASPLGALSRSSTSFKRRFTPARVASARATCKSAGLKDKVDLAICIHDAVTADHAEGAVHLAEFREIVRNVKFPL